MELRNEQMEGPARSSAMLVTLLHEGWSNHAMGRPLVHRMIHKSDRPGGGSEWACPFCRHQMVVWPLYRKVMVKGEPHTVHVKGKEEIPVHLDDLVVELTEADENWLILNSIAWSSAA